MNLVVLTGRFTRDPELKYTQSGKAFCKFSIAVDRTYKSDDVDFINCVAWEKTAELVGEYLRKGSKVGVQGKLRVSKYQGQDGQNRTSTEVYVEHVEFLDTKNTSGTRTETKKTTEDYKQQHSNNSNVPTNNVDDDDEFPF